MGRRSLMEYKCRCGFRTRSLQALAEHDVRTGHPNPDATEPVAVALARVQELCAKMGGHEPSLRFPGRCNVCGAALEVAHA